MKFFKINRTSILAGVLVVLAVYAYFNFFGGKAGSAPTTTPSPVSQDLLLSLTTLSMIQLNPDIFTDPVFLSLSDFGVQIPPEVVGRRNPFAPVGRQ